jgi:glucose/arabinose dehydrogenase
MNATSDRSSILAVLCLLLLQAGLQVATAQVEEEQSARPTGPPRYAAVGELYQELCSACHGESLQGTPLGISLLEEELLNGSSIAEIEKSIGDGNAEKEMPAWSAVLQKEQIQSLAIYVAEQRSGYSYDDYSIASSLEIPQGLQKSEHHDFYLDVVIDGLDALPYSIAPMPDGQILLSEKKRGLSVVSAEGVQSSLIAGTPPPQLNYEAPTNPLGLDRGIGWFQDVALHPDYESNGWIYLYHGDHCESCNDVSRENGRPVSMARVVRGRLRDGQWLDEESIWSTGVENYTATTDILLGGRIAFDSSGHLFFTIGAKAGFYEPGIQDIGKPWGKIHRVMDDGRIPPDNPFVGVSGAVKSIWTIGHRTPQGLEYDAETGILWGSEHGPRGGDEVNLLTPGSNYGWPFASRGVHYDGTAVEDMLDYEFDVAEIEQPVVDMTPSPAISSFVVYRGETFPHWEGNLIVGSLKAQTLFRMKIVDNALVELENLIDGIGRIRDIEVDADGTVLLLIENAAGGKIVRLGPGEIR